MEEIEKIEFSCYCQRVLPSVFPKGYSTYETLCIMLEKVNEVIDSNNGTIDAVEELQVNFTELETFVNDYFTNLDVQDEIDQKLDEMLANGDFDVLLGELGAAVAANTAAIAVNSAAIAVNVSDIADVVADVLANTNAIDTFSVSTVINVKDFGAVGDGVVDDTTAITNAFNSITEGVLYFPEGTYLYTGLPNMIKTNFTIRGDGSGLSTLSYSGTGIAVNLDAFESGSASDPFINNCNIEGISILGATMSTGIYAQGVSRSTWKDIKINGSDGTDGTVGLWIMGCMLNKYEDIYVSNEFNSLVPYRGMRIENGYRDGVSVGASSNNVFIHCYVDGNSIGIQFINNGSDQNIFIGGAAQRCTVYGYVGSGGRYNTFMNFGFENLGITNFDISDTCEFTKFINCYSSEEVRIQGKGCTIDGGYFEKITLASNATDVTVKDVVVNHWATGSGGFDNSAVGTRYSNVYDEDASEYIYENASRFGITPTGSPTLYTNDTNIPVRVAVIGGVVTQVVIRRGSDWWFEQKPTSGGNVNYIVAPGDVIDISYSSAPTINGIPLHNL